MGFMRNGYFEQSHNQTYRDTLALFWMAIVVGQPIKVRVLTMGMKSVAKKLLTF
jgi:hypothetical protein